MSNNPPKDADHYLEKLKEIEPLAMQWSQGVVNAGNAGTLRDLIGSIKSIAKDAEKDRKATKEPYLEQGRKIDTDFKPVKTTADSYVAPLNKMLSDYLAAEERRKREEAEKARLEAEAKAKAAEALKDDDFVGDHASKVAEQAEIEAKRAEREAENNSVKGNADERAMGLRTYRKASVTNAAMLVGHYANHPDVIAAAEKLANQEIRAAKGDEVSIPGIEIVEEKRAA